MTKQAHRNPTQLSRTFSPKGNPALTSLQAILKAMGLRLAGPPIGCTRRADACHLKLALMSVCGNMTATETTTLGGGFGSILGLRA